MPFWIPVKEFIFLISVFVPNLVSPTGRIEMFASQRKLPSSIRPSDTPKYCTIARILSTYWRASSPERRSGSDTISNNGTPVRL